MLGGHQALLNPGAHHEILQTHFILFLPAMCFILLLLTCETQEILAFLQPDSVFKFPNTFEFWEFFTARCRTTFSETVILKQIMKLHYSGAAIVFRFPNQVLFCCFNEPFLSFSFFQLKHFYLDFNLPLISQISVLLEKNCFTLLLYFTFLQFIKSQQEK